MRRITLIPIILLAAVLMGCGLGSVLGLAPPGGEPALMTRVLISKEGGGYKIQFSLQDSKIEDTSANGGLRITFEDYSDSTQIFYDQARSIKKGDFEKYKTLLGGEIWAYVFVLPSSQVPAYGSNTFARMRLHFAMDNGNVLDAEDSFFL